MTPYTTAGSVPGPWDVGAQNWDTSSPRLNWGDLVLAIKGETSSVSRGAWQWVESYVGAPVFKERMESGFGGGHRPLSPCLEAAPAFLLPPDPSVFWQIGLSLTFRPISERIKPLSDLIIFHFCLIAHILLLAEKESGSCPGRGWEGHPVPRWLWGQCSVSSGL